MQIQSEEIQMSRFTNTHLESEWDSEAELKYPSYHCPFFIWTNLFLSVRTCINVKTLKVVTFFICINLNIESIHILSVKNIVTRIIFKQIMSTKCFIHSSIYHRENICSKIINVSCINNFFPRIMNIKCFINSLLIIFRFRRRVKIPVLPLSIFYLHRRIFICT